MKELTGMVPSAPLIFCTVFFHLWAVEKVDVGADWPGPGRHSQLFRMADIGAIVRR